jgi:hypothetical protein
MLPEIRIPGSYSVADRRLERAAGAGSATAKQSCPSSSTVARQFLFVLQRGFTL